MPPTEEAVEPSETGQALDGWAAQLSRDTKEGERKEATWLCKVLCFLEESIPVSFLLLQPRDKDFGLGSSSSNASSGMLNFTLKDLLPSLLTLVCF